jgi:hypothetical protein
VPDPKCTPGAINPTVTLQVLTDPEFRTACIRNCVTTEQEKAATYELYGQPHPANNQGSTQTCELDHLIPLQLGGADTLDNIWPQCGPSDVTLAERYFKQKDIVENWLAEQVKTKQKDLGEVQRAIATDWTQFLRPAKSFCSMSPETCGLGE